MKYPIPTPHKITGLQLYQPEIVMLDNDIRLQIINLGIQDVSRIDIVIEGGSCDGKNIFISSLLAKTLQEGTATMTSAEIAEKLDYYGSWLSIRVSFHNTILSLYTINRHFDKVIEVLKEILVSPSFPEKELLNNKQTTINSLRNNNEKVGTLARYRFLSLFFGETHNWGRYPEAKDIEDISSEDLLQFHRQWFKPSNIKIILSGKVDSSMIVATNKIFGSIPQCGKHQDSNNDHPLVPFRHLTSFVNKTGALQSAIIMAQPTICRNHPDYIPLRILITALGGYFGSRLVTNIREDKGYTYGITAQLMGYRNTANLFISSQCATHYTLKVVEETQKEIRNLQLYPLSDDELYRVKAHMLSDYSRTLDTPFTIADFHLSMISEHIPDNYFNRHIEILESITPKQLQNIACRYLNPDKLLVVIAGNEEEIKKNVLGNGR